MLSFQPGNLPAAGYGAHSSKSRGIGCTAKHLLKIRVFCVAILRKDLVLRSISVCPAVLSYCLPALNKEGARTHGRITYKAAAVAMAAALSAALLVGCGSTAASTRQRCREPS